LQNRAPTLKKIFIWDDTKPIENREKKINHEFHFSTNPILKKSEIKKLEILKDQKL